MGKAAARAVIENGGRSLLASRDAERLERAKAEILQATGAAEDAVETRALDASDAAAVNYRVIQICLLPRRASRNNV